MTHDINAKIIKAHETFLAWRNVSFVERQKLVLRASEILKSHTEDFAKIITKEMHKPISQAIAEMCFIDGLLCKSRKYPCSREDRE